MSRIYEIVIDNLEVTVFLSQNLGFIKTFPQVL